MPYILWDKHYGWHHQRIKHAASLFSIFIKSTISHGGVGGGGPSHFFFYQKDLHIFLTHKIHKTHYKNSHRMKLDNTKINALSKADLDQYHVVHCFKGRDPFSDPFSSPKKKIFPVLILFAGKIFLSFLVNPRSEFLRNP